MSTGTSFSAALAVTTGAGPLSPPRPRPPRPPRPPPPPALGVSADVPLVHAPAARAAARHKEKIKNRFDTSQLQKALVVQEDTRRSAFVFTQRSSFDVSLHSSY